MTDTELKLLKSFPGSFVNDNGEFVAYRCGVASFNLANCKDDIEIKCKVLEKCSWAAFKAEPYKWRSRIAELHALMLARINAFLDTNFSPEDMELIYTKLGNGCNRPLCEKFVANEYDMEILR